MFMSPPVLFGLGLGMMLVSLLVMFWPSPGTSEWETIQEARKLGMVFREEVAVFDPSPDAEGSEEEGPTADHHSPEITTPEGQAQRAGSPGGDREVVIPPGSSLDSIADILWEQGIIREKEIFIELVQEMGAARSLKAGAYQLSQESDSYQVLKILRRGGEQK